MSIAKRLIKIETSLTPTEAVLLWLQEGQDNLDPRYDFLTHDQPQERIPQNVMAAVQEDCKKEALPPDMIKRSAIEAWEQTAFLVALVIECHGFIIKVLRSEALHLFLKRAEMMFFQVDTVRWTGPETEPLRNLLVEVIGKTWRGRSVVAEISRKYYDGHLVLDRPTQNALTGRINDVAESFRTYKAFEKLPSWKPIDLAALHRSNEEQVPGIVEALVASADVTARRGAELAFGVARR